MYFNTQGKLHTSKWHPCSSTLKEELPWITGKAPEKMCLTPCTSPSRGTSTYGGFGLSAVDVWALALGIETNQSILQEKQDFHFNLTQNMTRVTFWREALLLPASVSVSLNAKRIKAEQAWDHRHPYNQIKNLLGKTVVCFGKKIKWHASVL